VRYSRIKKPLFHATDKQFDVFDIDKSDLGVHFGNLEQAEYVLKHRSGQDGQNIHPVLLNMENPLRLKDEGCFHADCIADQLLKKKIIDKQLYDAIKSEDWKGRNKYNKIIRDLLLAKGYDGIVYKNTHEGRGDSYIAITIDQIRSIYKD